MGTHHSLSRDRMVEIENRIIELQRERNEHLVVCSQCFIFDWINGRDVDAPACEIRYAAASTPHKDETPALLRVDVTWKCPRCQSHVNGSIRMESEDELEGLIDLMGDTRYDAVKAAKDREVREEKLKALGYIED